MNSLYQRKIVGSFTESEEQLMEEQKDEIICWGFNPLGG